MKPIKGIYDLVYRKEVGIWPNIHTFGLLFSECYVIMLIVDSSFKHFLGWDTLPPEWVLALAISLPDYFHFNNWIQGKLNQSQQTISQG